VQSLAILKGILYFVSVVAASTLAVLVTRWLLV